MFGLLFECLFFRLMKFSIELHLIKSGWSIIYTVKPVLSGHSKIAKIKVLKTNGSLMKVELLQNALLEHSAILLTCIKR